MVGMNLKSAEVLEFETWNYQAWKVLEKGSDCDKHLWSPGEWNAVVVEFYNEMCGLKQQKYFFLFRVSIQRLVDV